MMAPTTTPTTTETTMPDDKTAPAESPAEGRPVAVMHPDNPADAPKGMPKVIHEAGPVEGYFEGIEHPDGSITWGS